MRRLALLFAVAAIVVGAATAGAEDPPGSEFIWPGDPRASQFAIPSTKKFDVEGALRTRVVQLLREKNPASSDPLTRQGLHVIWARRCPPGRQKLVFQRKVFFTGPEYKLGAAVQLFRGNATFKYAELRVNGVRLLRVSGHGGGFDRTADRPRVLRFGTNHIELTAVRKATYDGKPCNTSTAPGKYTGVAFNILGELASDVGLPPQVPQEYYRLPQGSGVAVPLKFDVRNKGPGGLARAPLNVQIHVTGTFDNMGYLFTMSDPESPVQSCTATPAAGTLRTGPTYVHCSAANLRAGDGFTQSLGVSYQPTQNTSEVFVRWSSFVDEPAGADGTDNERTKSLRICRSDDPNPNCPPPYPDP